MPDSRVELTGGEAITKILPSLFNELPAGATGSRQAADIEKLHDYRVVIRRLRVLLSQFKSIMPARQASYFLDELRWLGQVTGPLRDTDVALTALEKYRNWLPEELRDYLAPYQNYLQHNQIHCHERLMRTLADERYISFFTDWRNFYDKGSAEWSDEAQMPFSGMAGARIWRTYRKIARQGRVIDGNSPAEALHELRKKGKKLRYLLEFYDETIPATTVVKLLRPVRRLQTILGNHQDFAVQADSIQHFINVLAHGKTVPYQTYVALGILIGKLHERQANARKNFGRCFEQYSSKRIKKEFRELCNITENQTRAGRIF